MTLQSGVCRNPLTSFLNRTVYIFCFFSFETKSTFSVAYQKRRSILFDGFLWITQLKFVIVALGSSKFLLFLRWKLWLFLRNTAIFCCSLLNSLIIFSLYFCRLPVGNFNSMYTELQFIYRTCRDTHQLTFTQTSGSSCINVLFYHGTLMTFLEDLPFPMPVRKHAR